MLMRQFGFFGAVIAASVLVVQLSPDRAEAQDRRQECSARYKAAKADGALGGLTWPQFFSRCMIELKSAQEPAAEPVPAAAVPEPVNPLKPVPAPPALPTASETAPPAPSAAEAPAPEVVSPPPSTPAQLAPAVPPVETATPSPVPQEPAAGTLAAPAPSGPVFPSAIAPAYAKLKPGAARQKTCQDQYNANKATDSNAGLKWVQKGGGYLAECLKRLKGES
jgi:hypothetical protein